MDSPTGRATLYPAAPPARKGRATTATQRRTLVLVGNPNTGKSSLFNLLTGLTQKVGNFPGVTVERKVGKLRQGAADSVRLVDLPGTYGLYSAAEDERITRQVLLNPADPDHPEGVVVVADATNLKPSLLLCTQVADLGLPTVLVLNMADQLAPKRLQVDADALSRQLGLPVLLTSALKGTGVTALRALLARPLAPPQRRFFTLPEGFAALLQQLKAVRGLSSDYAAFNLLLTAPGTDALVAELRLQAGITKPEELIANEIVVRYDRIQDLLDSEGLRRQSFSNRLDKLLLHPTWGYLVLALILLLIFQAIFTWAAYPMEWIDAGMAAGGSALEQLLPAGFLRTLAVNGLWAGLQGIVTFVPQIALLFFFIALLEESGYMSRAVFLMDRLMRPFGLSGKSVIPLFGGFACAVPSIMAVRSIPNPKERLITLLITPLMSCSARIPVYTVLIAIFIPSHALWGLLDLRGLVMAGFYGLGIVVALGMALVFKRFLRAPAAGLFITELPNYRMPRWHNVSLQLWQKVSSFLFEAGKVILVLSIILSILGHFGPPKQMAHLQAAEAAVQWDNLPAAKAQQLQNQFAAQRLQSSYAGYLGRAIEPVLRPLGYDWKIGIALISSFAAREVFVSTMNTLYSLGEQDDETGYRTLSQRLGQEKDAQTGKAVYTPAVALSLLVFYALAMQCMSTLAVVRRETGRWKWALIMLAYQSGLAYVAALVTYQLFS